MQLCLLMGKSKRLALSITKPTFQTLINKLTQAMIIKDLLF